MCACVCVCVRVCVCVCNDDRLVGERSVVLFSVVVLQAVLLWRTLRVSPPSMPSRPCITHKLWRCVSLYCTNLRLQNPCPRLRFTTTPVSFDFRFVFFLRLFASVRREKKHIYHDDDDDDDDYNKTKKTKTKDAPVQFCVYRTRSTKPLLGSICGRN